MQEAAAEHAHVVAQMRADSEALRANCEARLLATERELHERLAELSKDSAKGSAAEAKYHDGAESAAEDPAQWLHGEMPSSRG